MKSLKKIKKIALLNALWMLPLVLMGMHLLVSCTAQTIPTVPPPSPTITRTPTITWTPGGPTPTVTSTVVPGSLGPGSVIFSAIITNGNAQQAFAPLVTLAAGTTIYLTNMAWDKTLSGITTSTGETGNFTSSYAGSLTCTSCGPASFSAEGAIEYYVPAGNTVASGTNLWSWSAVAESGNGGNAGNGVFAGSATYLKDSGNSSGDKIFAFTAASVNTSTNAVTGPVTFLAAILWGQDTWWQNEPGGGSGSPPNYWDTYLPKDLYSGGVTYGIDLSNLWNSNSALSGGNTNQDASLNCSIAASSSINSTWSAVSYVGDWTAYVGGKSAVGLPGEAMSASGCGLGWTTSESTTYTY